MRKKRLDVETLRRMGFIDELESEYYYEFDEPIRSLRVECYGGASQGDAPLKVTFFFDNNEEYAISAKGNWISTRLHALNDFNGYICADPRIIATYIEAAWLDFYFWKAGLNPNQQSHMITRFLSCDGAPVYSTEESLVWLEKNRFIGANSIKNKARAIGFYEYTQRKYIPYFEEGWNGWDIYYGDPKLYFLSPGAKAFYDFYIDDLRKAKALEAGKEALREKWSGKSDLEVYLESERLAESDDPLPPELEDEYFDMYNLFHDALKNRIERGQDEYYKLHPEELQYVNFFEEN